MREIVKLSVMLFILSGCAVDYYGHTQEEWNKLTPEQRKDAKANIKTLKEQQHNSDMTRKKIDDLLGSPSNQF